MNPAPSLHPSFFPPSRMKSVTLDTKHHLYPTVPPPSRCGPSKGPCIGSMFGLDVGGTLTKIVYVDSQDNAMQNLAVTERYKR